MNFTLPRLFTYYPLITVKHDKRLFKLHTRALHNFAFLWATVSWKLNNIGHIIEAFRKCMYNHKKFDRSDIESIGQMTYSVQKGQFEISSANILRSGLL